MEKSMKIVLTLLMLTLVVGCSAPYQKPQSGDTAILKLSEEDGTATRVFYIGELNDKNCAKKAIRIKEASYSEKDLVHVPAGKAFYLHVRSKSSKTFCKGSAAMTLEKDKIYTPIILPFSSYCSITVIENSPGKKGKAIDTKSLYSGCIKK
jgi:hypothetical protein